MLIKCELMHIGTANNITVSGKATGLTCPISILRLVFVLTYRTLATCSSFGASEAHDVGLLGFVGEIVDILAIFPEGHALVVVSTTVLLADTMGIPDEERANLLLSAEGDHLSCGFVSHITNPALCSRRDLVFGFLKLLPSPRILLASGLLLSNLPQLLGSLAFERPDTTASDDHGLPCVCRDGGKMDLTQIDCRVYITRCLLSLRLFNTDMQLKAIVPNEAASTAVFWKLNWQNDGFASLAHRQNNTSVFIAHSLSRPFDRIETFFSPRIFHLHLRMGFAKLTCGIDVGKKSMHHHLDRLTMHGKLSFGGLLQFVATGPLGMLHSCLLMGLTTEVPYLCCLHLSGFQASKQLWRRLQSIHLYGIHSCLLAFLLSFDMFLDGSQDLSVERPIVLSCHLSYLFQQISRKPDGEGFDLVFHTTILSLSWLHFKGLGPLCPSLRKGRRFHPDPHRH